MSEAPNIGESRIGLALRWSVFANLVANVLNLLGMVAFANILGVKLIAEYGILVVAVELLCLPFSFGFNQAVIRHPKSQSVYSASFSLILAQSAGLIAFFVLGVVLLKAADLDILPSIGGAFTLLVARIAGFIATLIYAPLEGELNYRPIAHAKLIAVVTALASAFGVMYIFASPNMFILIIRDVVSASVLLLLVFRTRQLKFELSRTHADLRKVWKFTKPIWQLNLLERAVLRVDYALVAIFLDRISFGVYFQIRAFVEGALSFVVGPIQTVIYAHFCRVQERLQVFRNVVKYWCIPALAIGMVVAWLLFASDFSSWIIVNVLGNEWHSGAVLIGWFWIYAVSMVLFEFAKVVGIAARIQRYALFGRFTQLILFCLSIVSLIEYFGLSGAGIASSTGAAILAIIAMGGLYRSAFFERYSFDT